METQPEAVITMEAQPSMRRQVGVGALLLATVALIAWAGSQASIPHTDGWYADVDKVPWSPPNAIFGPVWSLLYFALAVAGWLIWRAGYRKGRPNAAKRVLVIYGVQLALNAAWTPVFFAAYPSMGRPAWWLALGIIIALIASVVWLALAARRWSRAAAWIMVPYLAWLLFASTLNAGIIALN